MKRYQVQLNSEERTELQKLIASGVASARKLTRARILLKVDEGLAKSEVSLALDVSINTVTSVAPFKNKDWRPSNGKSQIVSTSTAWMAKRKPI